MRKSGGAAYRGSRCRGCEGRHAARVRLAEQDEVEVLDDRPNREACAQLEPAVVRARCIVLSVFDALGREVDVAAVLDCVEFSRESTPRAQSLPPPSANSTTVPAALADELGGTSRKTSYRNTRF